MNIFEEKLARLREEREREVSARTKAITQAGGTRAFLETNYPNLVGLIPHDVAPEELAGLMDFELREADQVLAWCGDRCYTQPVCREGLAPMWSDGRITWSPCERWLTAKRLLDLSSAGIGKRFLGKTFDNYKPRTQEQKKVLEACRKYAETFKSDKGLFIAGPVGTGKTHLSVAIAKAVFDKGYTIRFLPVPRALAAIRQAIGHGDEEAQDLLLNTRDVDLLVLDDLGAERVTDWVREQLYLVIDDRYQEEKAIVVTTNDTIEALEANVGQRIVSRIMEMCYGLVLDGPDFRKREAG